WLGGGTMGVIVTSVAFGAGHMLQGADAMLATGLLGAFWGVVYLRRRWCVAPLVSPSGFDLLQIVQFIVVGRCRSGGFAVVRRSLPREVAIDHVGASTD